VTKTRTSAVFALYTLTAAPPIDSSDVSSPTRSRPDPGPTEASGPHHLENAVEGAALVFIGLWRGCAFTSTARRQLSATSASWALCGRGALRACAQGVFWPAPRRCQCTPGHGDYHGVSDAVNRSQAPPRRVRRRPPRRASQKHAHLPRLLHLSSVSHSRRSYYDTPGPILSQALVTWRPAKSVRVVLAVCVVRFFGSDVYPLTPPFPFFPTSSGLSVIMLFVRTDTCYMCVICCHILVPTPGPPRLSFCGNVRCTYGGNAHWYGD